MIMEKSYDCLHVPRVGEIIQAGSLLNIPKEQVSSFFIYKVLWEATTTGMTPHVYCRRWHHGSRFEEMAQRGWQPTTGQAAIFDED